MLSISTAACCRGGVTFWTRWRCCNLAQGHSNHGRKDTLLFYFSVVWRPQHALRRRCAVLSQASVTGPNMLIQSLPALQDSSLDSVPVLCLFFGFLGGEVHQMGRSSEETVEPEAWVNAFLGRIFWDFLGEKYWANVISKKIQMKLSKIRVRGGTAGTHGCSGPVWSLK